jgi:UDP-N-acetylglucosamine acyltransferase
MHPSSIVEEGAKLGVNVRIGPLCHVGPDVVLGDNVELVSHAVVHGRTKIGEGTRLFPFSSVGHQPQDLKYHGEPSTLEIGVKCLIREGVTINPGTEGGGMRTVVGDHCAFLANSHVAHDCRVGNYVILSNNVMLAGHTSIGNYVIMGGGSAVHQFVRIGDHAFIGGLSGVEYDVIPYAMALGNRANLAGINLVGLKRRGFSREAIRNLHRAYLLLFAAEETVKERLNNVEAEFGGDPQVREIIAFVRTGGDRGLCTPRGDKGGGG